jgi:hypothetical protein
MMGRNTACKSDLELIHQMINIDLERLKSANSGNIFVVTLFGYQGYSLERSAPTTSDQKFLLILNFRLSCFKVGNLMAFN